MAPASTQSGIQARNAVDWNDPELLPPKGLACWNCSVNPPVVWLGDRLHIYYDYGTGKNLRETRRYALCLDCLGLWFPGWGGQRVMEWLEGQVQRRVAWEQGAEARAEANNQSLREWLGGYTSRR